MKENLDVKILATLGPSSMKESVVRAMDSSGVDIFRINLSHTKLDDFVGVAESIQSWTKKPICVDTEGAQIRTGKMKDGAVTLKSNSAVFLASSDVLGEESNIPLYPIAPDKDLQVGDILSLDFNAAVVQVVKIEGKDVEARVLFGGKVGSNKGVALDRSVNLPAFTEKDLKILEISREMKLCHFALSFAGRKEDVEFLRNFFPYPVFIISKIESKLGLMNLRDICQASSAILIDRGDLSREVPLQKIALAQKHILDAARETRTPVYVATNLLESMLENFQPTRAEINDITSTLLSGAEGLVLAAETAIGRYPVESVRMAAGVIKETKNYQENISVHNNSKNYFESISDFRMIEPHGGMLVQNLTEPGQTLDNLPKIEVDEATLLDVMQIAQGVYSPIAGFMNKEELMSVLEGCKLRNGATWTMPILFQMDKADKNLVGKRAALTYRDAKTYGIIEIADIEELDLQEVSKKWFGTNDDNHPGAAKFKQRGKYIASGRVWLQNKLPYSGQTYALSPRQTRTLFKNFGWQKIVGFHTRNVIHGGHEFIQKKALDAIKADALFISPVIGPKKETDFSAKAILKSYEVMLQNDYYNPYPALIAAFATYSRYAGPREAVFTALCRKNFGCSHFVVGRDHTGVGGYYPQDASQRIFEELGDIGIKPLMFDTAYYCKECARVTDGCSHPLKQRLSISGTEVRKHLLDGQPVPDYLIRKEISLALSEIGKESKENLFETSRTK